MSGVEGGHSEDRLLSNYSGRGSVNKTGIITWSRPPLENKHREKEGMAFESR